MNYNTIRRNFEKGLWPESYVRMAVRKGVITQVECDEILSGAKPGSSVQAAVDEAIGILTGEVEA